MKTLKNLFGYLVVIIALTQIVSCTKSSNSVVPKTATTSKKVTFTDSSYIAHVAIDSTRHDSLRTFTFYCFITTTHSSTRLTVPGTFTVTGTLFAGTPIQSTGSIGIFAGQNYGSNTFSTTTNYPLTYTSISCSPSTYNGGTITISHYIGNFTP